MSEKTHSPVKKLKVGWSQYHKPTPKNFRRLGDALFTASTTITGTAIAMEFPSVALYAVISGYVGKLLTNFFTEH